MKQQLTKTTTFFLFSCISIALICFLFPVKLNAAHYEINLSISDDLNASGRGYSFNTNTLTFSNGANIHTYTFIQTGATTVRFINFQTGVATTVTLNGININPMYMTLQGNAQLNLLLSGTNTANGMIAVVDPAKLTIDNAPGSNGLLTMTNFENGLYSNYAVIGGTTGSTGGQVIINGGTLDITQGSGSSGAAIGGGGNGTGNVTINGGNITATSSGSGAAIGAGSGKDGTVVITNGIVNALAEYSNAAAIGGGLGSTFGGNGIVTITGGIITASAGNGAAIGNGVGEIGEGVSLITISNAKVTTYSISGTGIGRGNGNSKTNNLPVLDICHTADITFIGRAQYDVYAGFSGSNIGDGYFVNLRYWASEGESFRANEIYIFDTNDILLRVITVPFTSGFEAVAFSTGTTDNNTNYKVLLDNGDGLREYTRVCNFLHGTNRPIHAVKVMQGYTVYEYENPNEYSKRDELPVVAATGAGAGPFWLVTEIYVDKFGQPIEGKANTTMLFSNGGIYSKNIPPIPGCVSLGYKWSPLDGTGNDFEEGNPPNKTITNHETIYFVYLTCTPPSITAQPANTRQTLCEKDGAFPTLSITATGTGDLTYQWYINTTKSNSGGTIISGATQNNYTPSSDLLAPGIYYFYCVVKGECGEIASNASARHTVTAPEKPGVVITVEAE